VCKSIYRTVGERSKLSLHSLMAPGKQGPVDIHTTQRGAYLFPRTTEQRRPPTTTTTSPAAATTLTTTVDDDDDDANQDIIDNNMGKIQRHTHAPPRTAATTATTTATATGVGASTLSRRRSGYGDVSARPAVVGNAVPTFRLALPQLGDGARRLALHL
jgi:hypothetical protein